VKDARELEWFERGYSHHVDGLGVCTPHQRTVLCGRPPESLFAERELSVLEGKAHVSFDQAGAVDIIGNLESAVVSTNTGTIHADVPLEALKFNFIWSASKPRYLSDVELPEVKEKAAQLPAREQRSGDEQQEQVEDNTEHKRAETELGATRQQPYRKWVDRESHADDGESDPIFDIPAR